MKKPAILKNSIKFCPKSGRPVKALNKWVLPLFGILSLAWVIIRVLPKPQRATYPCMKVAIPFATSFLLYMSSLLASAYLFKQAFKKIGQTKYLLASLLILLGIFFSISTILVNHNSSFAYPTSDGDFNYTDPLGPNQPIGEAKGIFPGRVVWMHNPNATNENCQPAEHGDGYFLEKNADQVVVDDMLKKAMLEITGTTTEEEAWNEVFRYFNLNNDKGQVGYAAGEKIFIKINAVHAWTTNEDLSIKLDNVYGDVDTSPHVILAVLRQLVNKAGVPQEAIYIGDPFTNIFKHLYEKLAAEFPNIHYMSRQDHENREQLQTTNTEEIHFSDKGTVLDVLTDSYYDCTINADYVLNIPAMKGHRGGGVTFFAKNHFGTNVQSSASHMHAGLVKAVNGEPIRDAYKQYRVLVDLMAYKHLGGKTLIYIGDFLWGTSMEHDPPVKFLSAPFNNDWSSSILVSLDPVAISSVALDILQEEFKEEDLSADPPRYLYPHYTGVDDYLHQAASSDWWPEGITYDPEDDGTPIGSLGVHEHWNNAQDRKYSRNLGTGNGIELIYEKSGYTSVHTTKALELSLTVVTPNAGSGLEFKVNKDLNSNSRVKIYSLSGQLLQTDQVQNIQANSLVTVPLNNLKTGSYIFHIESGGYSASSAFIVQD